MGRVRRDSGICILVCTSLAAQAVLNAVAAARTQTTSGAGSAATW